MRLLWLTLLSVIITPGLWAQTITATSCNNTATDPAVNNAFALATASTTKIIIPAGTCIWTIPLSFSTPSGNANLTVQGSGNTTGSDSQGTPTGYNDQTILIDHTGAKSYFSNVITTVNMFLRFTGISFKGDSGSTLTTNCMFAIGGTTLSVRVDHSHFWDAGVPGGGQCLSIFYGAVNGVLDHNVYSMPSGGTDNGFRASNGETAYGDSSGTGNNTWANPTAFGTSAFLFAENNLFIGSAANDCKAACRVVFRYNNQAASFFQTHEMEGDTRGSRAVEVYHNLSTSDGTTPEGDFFQSRMGTGLVYMNQGDTAGSLWITLLDMEQDRTNGHPFLTPPNGFGYCGTMGVISGPSNWDQNTPRLRCIDQVGSGQGDQLSGLFPSKCNTTTGCTTFTGAQTHAAIEPYYEWLDKFIPRTGSGGLTCFSGDTNTILVNQDFYCNTQTWNGTSFTGIAFNGTVGTGSGTLTPTTSGAYSGAPVCTPGPGGAPGVGYWDITNNSLYVCEGSGSGTWTLYYTPYVYPHPLDTTTGTVTISPSTLPGGTVGVSYSQTLTASGGTSPYTWSVLSGTLPAGTSLNTSTGVISGTPNTATTYSFTIKVQDSTGTPLIATQPYNVTIAGAATPPVSAPCISNCISSVIFQKQSSPVPGNWMGQYGNDGYILPTVSQSLPKYVAFASSASTYSWTNSTSDGRGLQWKTSRVAPCWYGANYTLDVMITDGLTHPFTVYLVDWDSFARAETITLTDFTTGKVLDSRSVSGFNGGTYLTWNCSGHFKVNVASTSGANGVISGVFFN